LLGTWSRLTHKCTAFLCVCWLLVLRFSLLALDNWSRW
jgi:hypothetical protein